MSSPNSSSSKKAFLNSLLDRQLHITVTDGRIFKGNFVCTDQDGSAILTDAHEHRGANSRSVSIVVIPGKHAKKVELVNDDARYI